MGSAFVSVAISIRSVSHSRCPRVSNDSDNADDKEGVENSRFRRTAADECGTLHRFGENFCATTVVGVNAVYLV